jgi:hypothetical protein
MSYEERPAGEIILHGDGLRYVPDRRTVNRSRVVGRLLRRTQNGGIQPEFTSSAGAVMAGVCANKAHRVITGSTRSTTGWKRKA